MDPSHKLGTNSARVTYFDKVVALLPFWWLSVATWVNFKWLFLCLAAMVISRVTWCDHISDYMGLSNIFISANFIWSHRQFHAVKLYFYYLKADIDSAYEVVKHSASICNRHRRKSGFMDSLYKQKTYYDDLTKGEKQSFFRKSLKKQFHFLQIFMMLTSSSQPSWHTNKESI